MIREILEQKDKPICLLDDEKSFPRRRKLRNRRQLKMEKILTAPKVEELEEERENLEQYSESDSNESSEIDSHDHNNPVENVSLVVIKEGNDSRCMKSESENKEENKCQTTVKQQNEQTVSNPIKNVSVYRTKEIQVRLVITSLCRARVD